MRQVECGMGASWVYFIECQANGLIKIGVSADVQTRIRSLQGGSPFPLRFLVQAPGNPDTEKALHSIFQKHRAHGEWFRGEDDIRTLVTQLQALPEGVREAHLETFTGVRMVKGSFPKSGVLRGHKVALAKEALKQTSGNKKQAAERLGIDRRTIYRLLKDDRRCAPNNADDPGTEGARP